MSLSQQQQEQAVRIQATARRDGVLRQLRNTMHHAHDFNSRQKRVAVLTHQLAELDTVNERFKRLDPHHVTRLATIAVLALAAYTVDLALYRPVAQFFSGTDIPSWIRWLFTFTLPAGILFIELGISAHRTHHRELHVNHLEGPASYAFWVVISALMTIVIPGAVVATFLAGFQDLSPYVRLAILISLALLALLSHAAIIWGGDLAIEAKTLTRYRFRRFRLRRRINDEGGPLNNAQQATRDAFASFIQARDSFNAENPAGMRLGPPLIDTVTVEVLRGIYGREVIQMPSDNSAVGQAQIPVNPFSPAPESSENVSNPQRNDAQAHERPGNPDNGSSNYSATPANEESSENGEVDYLRTILYRRIREADGELKP